MAAILNVAVVRDSGSTNVAIKSLIGFQDCTHQQLQQTVVVQPQHVVLGQGSLRAADGSILVAHDLVQLQESYAFWPAHELLQLAPPVSGQLCAVAAVSATVVRCWCACIGIESLLM